MIRSSNLAGSLWSGNSSCPSTIVWEDVRQTDSAAEAMKDRDLLTEAKRQNLDITPTSGEDLESLAKQVTASQKPEVIERVKKLLGE